MKSFRPLLLFVLLFTGIGFRLFAENAATISYAEGNGFILVSEGIRTEFDIVGDDVVGLPLEEGDTILTDESSFLEIQLAGGNGGVVKIAENTTFTISDLEAGGGGVFQVAYGRIRVKVASLLAGSRLWVTGHDTVAGVRGTDFGYDLFYDQADQGAERQTAVYCFEGEVDVLQYDKETISKIDLLSADPFLLTAGKMVKTRSSAPDTKIRATAIDEEIIEYWGANPVETPVDIADSDELTISDDLDLSVDPDSLGYRYATGGKITFGLGVGLMTIGGILRALVPNNPGVTDFSNGLLVVGGTATAAGAGMMVYSFSLR